MKNKEIFKIKNKKYKVSRKDKKFPLKKKI
jgi:hypothetical protein